MPVYQNFYNVDTANHGLYTAISGSFAGYHAVTALGYDATGLRIENQWGTGWGDAGWATLGWAFVNKYVVEARAVGAMVDPDPQPKLLADPVASGVLNRGATLSATTGRYTASPTGYAYQWQRDTGSGFADISGATSATYVSAPLTSRSRSASSSPRPTPTAPSPAPRSPSGRSSPSRRRPPSPRPSPAPPPAARS